MGVDGHGQIGLGFGAIDGGVGGCIENDFRVGAANEIAYLIGNSQIDGFAIDGDDGSATGKGALELAADLPGCANDENARFSLEGEMPEDIVRILIGRDGDGSGLGC